VKNKSVPDFVELTDGGARIERWDGSGWVSGGTDFAAIPFLPPASPEILAAAGLPPDAY